MENGVTPAIYSVCGNTLNMLMYNVATGTPIALIEMGHSSLVGACYYLYDCLHHKCITDMNWYKDIAWWCVCHKYNSW